MVIRFEMDFFQCCQGYNATLLAYGQTGSGKSYSMVGYGANKGLVPKLSERLFQDIKGNLQTKQCQVCVCVCLLSCNCLEWQCANTDLHLHAGLLQHVGNL